jgi:hypothetical protein
MKMDEVIGYVLEGLVLHNMHIHWKRPMATEERLLEITSSEKQVSILPMDYDSVTKVAKHGDRNFDQDGPGPEI